MNLIIIGMFFCNCLFSLMVNSAELNLTEADINKTSMADILKLSKAVDPVLLESAGVPQTVAETADDPVLESAAAAPETVVASESAAVSESAAAPVSRVTESPDDINTQSKTESVDTAQINILPILREQDDNLEPKTNESLPGTVDINTEPKTNAANNANNTATDTNDQIGMLRVPKTGKINLTGNPGVLNYQPVF